MSAEPTITLNRAHQAGVLLLAITLGCVAGAIAGMMFGGDQHSILAGLGAVLLATLLVGWLPIVVNNCPASTWATLHVFATIGRMMLAIALALGNDLSAGVPNRTALYAVVLAASIMMLAIETAMAIRTLHTVGGPTQPITE